MSFEEIFCQDKAVSVLQRAFASDKIAHAYIFSGSEGVGKFKTVCQWSKLLLCAEPITQNGITDSCGQCPSCIKFQNGSHPDFNHIHKELLEFTEGGKSKAAPVDLPIAVIREFLIAKVSSRPVFSKRKIFVVSEAEKLNKHSQNALLKILEEAPQYCCIILLCTRLQSLLPTTKSRCQTIPFLPISEDKITEQLKQAGAEKKTAKYFARLANGSLGMACKLVQLESEGADFYQTKKEIINSLCNLSLGDTLNLAEKILSQAKTISEIWAKLNKEMSKPDIKRTVGKIMIRIIMSALYDAMRLDFVQAESLVNFDQLEDIKKLAARFNCEQAAEKISQANQAIQQIESNVNERLIFERLLLNVAVSDSMACSNVQR